MPQFNNFEDLNKHIKGQEERGKKVEEEESSQEKPSKEERLSQEEKVIEEERTMESVEEDLPDVEELDNLLNETDEVINISKMSKKEVDELIEKRQENINSVREKDLGRESQIRKMEQFDLPDALNNNDYDRLGREGIISETYAEKLKKIEDKIKELREIEHPSGYIEDSLEKLLSTKNQISEKIKEKIEEEKSKLMEQKDEMIEFYREEVGRLEDEIAQIEENPNVFERLKEMAREGMNREFRRREVEKKKEGVRPYIQSLGDKHRERFERLGEILGIDNPREELRNRFEALEEKRKKRGTKALDKYFFDLRSQIRKAIIEEEGENQIEDPGEIIPWKGDSSKIPYKEAIISITKNKSTIESLTKASQDGDQEAINLLAEIEKLSKENQLFHTLIGKKNKKKEKAPLYTAFDERKENDKKGITEARKKERERKLREKEEEKARKEEEIKQVIERGGFEVEVPIFQKVKKEIVGKEKGAVRLEKVKSKKGNDCWEIKELVGGAKKGDAKINFRSPLDGSGFSRWLREGMRKEGLLV